MAQIRESKRYLINWRVAIVHDGDGIRRTFNGKAYELSTDGVSVYCEYNFFFESPVILLLALPPLSAKTGEQIIEIRSKMISTVLANNSFRIGLQFLSFKPGDQESLAKHLESISSW